MFAVHCRVKPGGALNVLEVLLLKKHLSGQKIQGIYTLYSDRDVLVLEHEGREIQIPIVTSLPRWINNIFRRSDENKPRIISSIIDYRNLMPFFPVLMKLLSRKLARAIGGAEEKTSILISSYAVAKNIDLPENTNTEIYFHQAMHYIRSLYDDYVGAMTGWKKHLYKHITPYLRRWDSKPRNYDIIYANSEYTKSTLSDIYGLKTEDIQVLHCPLDPMFFDRTVVSHPDNYFFYINRLTKLFKHLDKIILMCNHYNIPLLIAGDGPDKEYLMSIAGPSITFLGRISNPETKSKLMSRARGVINIAHESFGIVTAESLLLGVPVFGYAHGATPELVDEKSGILTDSVFTETMYPLFEEFVSRDFDRQEIQNNAKKVLMEKQKFWRIEAES